jgi:hypothetical protein
MTIEVSALSTHPSDIRLLGETIDQE